MSNKLLGIVLIVVGVLLIAFDFVAPSFGIGSHNLFTLKKLALGAVGVIAIVVGIVLSARKTAAA